MAAPSIATSVFKLGVARQQAGFKYRANDRVAKRTALLIRCSREEADKIREMAQRERRTVSGYVLHAVISRIAIQERLQQRQWIKRKP